jgi:hypothetical protein
MDGDKLMRIIRQEPDDTELAEEEVQESAVKYGFNLNDAENATTNDLISFISQEADIRCSRRV